MKYQLIEHKQTVDEKKIRNIKKGITYVYKAYGIENGDIKVIETFDEKESALQELKKYKSSVENWRWNRQNYHSYRDITEYYVVEYDETNNVMLNPIEFSEIIFGLKDIETDEMMTFETYNDVLDFLRERKRECGGETSTKPIGLELIENCEKHENHYEEDWKRKRASKNKVQ